ncbi:MAG TPA: potassium channel family protein [Granulicella sp.]
MHTLALIAGVLFCLFVILDAFQTIILPRRPTGRLRLTWIFYIVTWTPWAAITRRIRNEKQRDQIYSIYGPFSLLLLLGVWAVLLITGFALIYLSLGSPFHDTILVHLAGHPINFVTDLYVSGTTLFTLGLGDVVPLAPLARIIFICESGVGLGFVAMVVGYLPVLYGAFSKREVAVALLDARAGSPPTATELLTRHGFEGGETDLIALLAEWERWSAELLETHVSYPLLCYYRSQHDNQSWLSALVAITDACALLIASQLPRPVRGVPPGRQAQLTFAISRHALVDLCHVFQLDKRVKSLAQSSNSDSNDRLPPEQFQRVCSLLQPTSVEMCSDASSAERLTKLRAMYESHAKALAEYLALSLPLWAPKPQAKKDAWKQVSELRAIPEPLFGTAELHISERSTAIHLHDQEYR